LHDKGVSMLLSPAKSRGASDECARRDRSGGLRRAAVRDVHAVAMELRTARLLLRELELADAPSANAYEREESVVRYQSHGPRTLEESRAYIERVQRETAAQSPRRLFDLAIVMRDEERFVGRAGFVVRDPEQREASIWWVVDPSFQGRGIATEAARALLDHAFGPLDLHRVSADCDPRNEPSLRVAGKLGMRREAHFVENAWIKGEWTDSVIFAVLSREWAARRR
jgi:RimJ/RimL family protein N-acetyltransferase